MFSKHKINHCNGKELGKFSTVRLCSVQLYTSNNIQSPPWLSKDDFFSSFCCLFFRTFPCAPLLMFKIAAEPLAPLQLLVEEGE